MSPRPGGWTSGGRDGPAPFLGADTREGCVSRSREAHTQRRPRARGGGEQAAGPAHRAHLRRQQAALPQLAVNLQPLFQQQVLLLAQRVNLPTDLLLALGAALPQLPTLLGQLLLQVLQPAGHSHNVLVEGLGAAPPVTREGQAPPSQGPQDRPALPWRLRRRTVQKEAGLSVLYKLGSGGLGDLSL